MSTHSIGTPDGGESKHRRINSPYPTSPLNELDGVVENGAQNAAEQKNHLRQPVFVDVPSEPITLAAIAKLLDSRLTPVTESMSTLEKKMSDMQLKIEASTKAALTEAVDPIKVDVKDLQSRMKAVETANVTQQAPIPTELLTFIDQADPAHKQIALLGFPDIAPAERIEHMETLLSKFSSFKACDYGTFYSGPRNNRSRTWNCYSEFPTTNIAKAFLEAAKSHVMTIGGQNIRIKKANTKIILQRNWAMKKAIELIQQSGVPGAATAKMDWQERTIKIKDDIVFKQEKLELKGSFLGAVSQLSLP